MKTSGNTILVTGGGTGIGRALAQAWHAAGNVVIVTGRTRESLEETVAGREGLHAMPLDVTDPEPLPDDHPLWSEPRCLVTPHVANTPEMGLDLLTPFVEDNVRRFLAGRPLLAPVDIGLGY